MPTDLQTTNLWLAIGAIAIAIQTLMMLAAAFMGFRMYRKVENTMQDLETRYVQPTEARLMALMDDVQDVTARVRRVDDTIRAKLSDINGAAELAKSAVASKAWPIVGVARALDAGIRALARRNNHIDPAGRRRVDTAVRTPVETVRDVAAPPVRERTAY